MKSFLRTLFFALFVITAGFSAVVVNAQDLDDVTLSGRLSDSNGLPIVGATVTATHVESGAARTTVTDTDGRYRIIELKPGLYKVKASAEGFGAKERIDLQTVSGQNLQLSGFETSRSTRVMRTLRPPA